MRERIFRRFRWSSAFRLHEDKLKPDLERERADHDFGSFIERGFAIERRLP